MTQALLVSRYNRKAVVGLAWLAPTLVLTTILMALSGCSAPNNLTSPYAEQYSAAARTAQSDYVRTILESGEISSADLKDAEQHVLTCTSGLGMVATFDTNQWGLDEYALVTTGESTPVEDKAASRCFDLWMGPILQLFNDQFVNPDNKDWNTLVASCLVRKGLAPDGFTGADYSNLMAQTAQQMLVPASSGDEGSITMTYTEPIDVRIPGGASLIDPAAQACQTVPLQ